jgi:hypothetical protein
MDNTLSGGTYQSLYDITINDIRPLPGTLVVLRFNKKVLADKYYVGIGDDYSREPYRNHDIIARGTWDECYPRVQVRLCYRKDWCCHEICTDEGTVPVSRR